MPGRRRSLKLLGQLIALFTLGFSALHAASLKATLDRDTIILGENATLTLQLDGGQLSGTPNLPAIPSLQVVGTSSSQQSTIVNGKVETIQSFAFTLNATQSGEITIPALQLNLNGQRTASTPLKLKVLLQDPNSPPASLATNLAFLWITLPKSELYVGEAVVGEVRLYLHSRVGDISNFQMPALTGDGFVLGKPNQSPQFQRKVGNETFTVIPMQFTASAIKTGPLTIDGINTSVVVHGGQRDFFGRYNQSAQAALTTEPQTYRSLPLPVENTPANFTGAVGNYTMKASVGPTNITAGDPITLRVEISGRGALDSITLPDLKSWEGFKTYPATSSVETSDKFGLQGTKIFEQILSPENSDIKEVPALSFSFFDPETKQFRTLTHPPTKLTVRQGGTVAAPVIAARLNSNDNQPPPQQDIVPIKQRFGTPINNTSPLVTRPIFLAAQTTPIVAFLLAFIWRKRADSLANNPRLRRRQKVQETISAGLKNIRQLATQNKSDEFFAELSRLLQEKLGERLDTSASAITEAVIDERLRPLSVPNATLDELHSLFQACNLARYAPIKSSQELTAMIPRLEIVLEKLDEVDA